MQPLLVGRVQLIPSAGANVAAFASPVQVGLVN